MAIYNMGMIVVFLLTLTELAQWVISGNTTSHVDDLIRDWDAYKLHLLMEEQQLEATAYARDEEEKEREDQVSDSRQLVSRSVAWPAGRPAGQPCKRTQPAS